MLYAAFLLFLAAVSSTPTCRVTEPQFPAYATGAIQAAVDRCSSSGGTVIIAPGTYLSAAVVISGSVNIHFSLGARLVAGSQVMIWTRNLLRITCTSPS